MKAQKLRQGKGYDNRVMYCFDCSMDITVEEKQDNTNTLDRAILHYTVRDGDRGYFSKEYIPYGMPKKGTKKPDITAIMESNTERKVKWYIYDLKDTVINTNTDRKLRLFSIFWMGFLLMKRYQVDRNLMISIIYL